MVKRPEEEFEFIRNRKFPNPPNRRRIMGGRMFSGSKVVVNSLAREHPIACQGPKGEISLEMRVRIESINHTELKLSRDDKRGELRFQLLFCQKEYNLRVVHDFGRRPWMRLARGGWQGTHLSFQMSIL